MNRSTEFVKINKSTIFQWRSQNSRCRRLARCKKKKNGFVDFNLQTEVWRVRRGGPGQSGGRVTLTPSVSGTRGDGPKSPTQEEERSFCEVWFHASNAADVSSAV